MRKKINTKKTIGVTSIVSSVALEIATIISSLPIRYYKEQYRKYLKEFGKNNGINKMLYSSMSDIQKRVLDTWKDKIVKTRVQTIVLGTSAVVCAAIGIKVNSSINKDVHQIMRKEKRDIKRVTQNMALLTMK